MQKVKVRLERGEWTGEVKRAEPILRDEHIRCERGQEMEPTYVKEGKILARMRGRRSRSRVSRETTQGEQRSRAISEAGDHHRKPQRSSDMHTVVVDRKQGVERSEQLKTSACTPGDGP